LDELAVDILRKGCGGDSNDFAYTAAVSSLINENMREIIE